MWPTTVNASSSSGAGWPGRSNKQKPYVARSPAAPGLMMDARPYRAMSSRATTGSMQSRSGTKMAPAPSLRRCGRLAGSRSRRSAALAEEHLCFGEQLGGNQLGLRRRLGQRDELNGGAMARHHLPPAAMVQRVHGVQTEPRGEHPIERRRAPAALHVAQDGDAGLFPGSLSDLRLEQCPDAGEADVAERVHLAEV